MMCKNDKDKYLILFTLKKLALIEGKLAIFVDDMIEAYRLKFFFNRFHMKAFVLSPDLAKQQITSIIHYFSIGQFDIVICLNSGYTNDNAPVFKDLTFVVNFGLPEQYARYKETGGYIDKEEGAIINLITPAEEKKNQQLANFQKKMIKAYSRNDMIRCIPVIWHEVVKIKGRVEEVLLSLSNKRVRDEKVLEFKKMVVSNKSLKEYFKSNPVEKEVLMNDIQKNQFKDKILFRHLNTLPFYAIPKEIMATTPDQIEICTVGSGAYIPNWTNFKVDDDRQLKNSIQGFQIVYAEPEEIETSLLVNSLIQFPIASKKFA